LIKTQDGLGFSLLKKTWRINKYKDPNDEISTLLKAGMSDEAIKAIFPEAFIAEEVFHQNVALNEGLQLMLDLLIGAGGTVFSEANAYLGVGDSTTSEDATQTGLQASTNKLYKAMDTSYPQRSAQTVDWRATFGTSDANFAWEEFTVANGGSDASVNLNRKVTSKGTKSSGETWTLSLQITAS